MVGLLWVLNHRAEPETDASNRIAAQAVTTPMRFAKGRPGDCSGPSEPLTKPNNKRKSHRERGGQHHVQCHH